jgi:hypothetical protein
VATLRTKLEEVKAREEERQFELDRLSKAKQEMEYKLGFGQGKESVAEVDAFVVELQQQLERVKAQSASTVSALQDKLHWYRENQDMLNHQDSLVTELRQENEQLKARVDNGDGSALASPAKGKGGAAGRGRSLADIKRIKGLEQQVVQLQADMKRRFPDSISNLIQAVGNPEADANGEELERLRMELDRKSEEMERKLRVMRQGHDQLRAKHQAYVESHLQSNDDSPRGGGGGGGGTGGTGGTGGAGKRFGGRGGVGGTARKTKGGGGLSEEEHEALMEKQRRYYTKKIQEAREKHESQMRAVRSGRPNGAADDASAGGEELQRMQRRALAAESAVKRLTAAVESGAGAGETAGVSMDALEVLRSQWEQRHEDQIVELRQKLAAAEGGGEGTCLVEGGERSGAGGTGRDGGEVVALKLQVRQLQQQLGTAGGGASEQALLQHFLSMADDQVGLVKEW